MDSTGYRHADHNLWRIVSAMGTVQRGWEKDAKGNTIALPEVICPDFHQLMIARDIGWQFSVKARFGGIERIKKNEEDLAKQQFTEFSVTKEEGLHKGYDRCQKILSQLNQVQARPDNDDINRSFLVATYLLVIKIWIYEDFDHGDQLEMKNMDLKVGNWLCSPWDYRFEKDHAAENKTGEIEDRGDWVTAIRPQHEVTLGGIKDHIFGDTKGVMVDDPSTDNGIGEHVSTNSTSQLQQPEQKVTVSTQKYPWMINQMAQEEDGSCELQNNQTVIYTRFKSDTPAGTQETNVDAGTQDHDSDSEVDEQVIVVPSFPSNSFAGPSSSNGSSVWKECDFAEKSLLSFKDKNMKLRTQLHVMVIWGLLGIGSVGLRGSAVHLFFAGPNFLYMPDESTLLLLDKPTSISKALRILIGLMLCRRDETVHHTASMETCSLYLMANIAIGTKLDFEKQEGCQRNSVVKDSVYGLHHSPRALVCKIVCIFCYITITEELVLLTRQMFIKKGFQGYTFGKGLCGLTSSLGSTNKAGVMNLRGVKMLPACYFYQAKTKYVKTMLTKVRHGKRNLWMSNFWAVRVNFMAVARSRLLWLLLLQNEYVAAARLLCKDSGFRTSCWGYGIQLHEYQNSFIDNQ
ncbi:hypothetical protein Tco_1253091 [Tanacetum coccineum]